MNIIILFKTTFYKILTILVICALMSAPLIYAADDEEDLLEELEELKEKEDKYRDLITIKQQERATIENQVRTIEKQSAKIEEDINQNTNKIENIASDITSIKKQVELKNNAIDEQKQLLAYMVRTQYLAQTEGAQTPVFFARDTSFAAADRGTQTTDKLNELTGLILNERAQLEQDEKDLAKKRQDIQDAQYQLQERNSALESTKSYQTILAAEVATEEDKYKERLDKVLQEQLSIQSEIDSLSSSYVGEFSLADLPSKDKADLDRPVKKPYIVTQGYGRTSFSHNYKGGMHNGIDYVAKGDDDIIAAADGKVKATGNMGRYGYGRWVAIDHGNGLVSLYGHLRSVKVDKGDKVDQGDKLGVIGTTGFSTGVHVHFTLFAASTFKIVASSSVSGVYIPTGATVNPALFL